MSARELYESNLDRINAVIQKVARRNRLSDEETDEFWSDVHFKLLKDDLRVLREYRGAGSLERFIVAVATRELLDRRNRNWGKWRPSNGARKLGPIAVLFERLVNRDGLSVDDAIKTLRTNYGVRSDEELEGLVSALPPSKAALTEAEIDPDELSEPRFSESPERVVVLRERKTLAARIQPVFSRTFAKLGSEDRLLFRMFYERGFTWAQIARVRGLDQQRLYKFKERVHGELREALEAEGVSVEQLEQLFRNDLLDLEWGGTRKAPNESVAGDGGSVNDGGQCE